MSTSIYQMIQISEHRSYYKEQEVHAYFERLHTVKEGLTLLAKGILYRLQYTEEEGISPSIDEHTIIAAYIGWLIWSGKEEKAKTLIRGLIQLSNGITFYEFISEMTLVHPITALLINKIYDDFV